MWRQYALKEMNTKTGMSNLCNCLLFGTFSWPRIVALLQFHVQCMIVHELLARGYCSSCILYLSFRCPIILHHYLRFLVTCINFHDYGLRWVLEVFLMPQRGYGSWPIAFGIFPKLQRTFKMFFLTPRKY
jgi:hypothetical protein